MALVTERHETARPVTQRRGAQPIALRALLLRVVQKADDTWWKRKGNEVTGRQYDVMVAVAAATGASQTALVEMTGIDRSTLADLVRRLCKRGLLQRKRTKEDSRTYAVKLTDEGTRVLRQFSALSREVDQSIAKPLSTLEASTLRALLERMAA